MNRHLQKLLLPQKAKPDTPEDTINRSLSPTEAWGLYQEGYWIARVRIVSDRSDETMERCTLRVLEHLRVAPAMPVPNIGEYFEYVWQRGGMCCGMARLTRM